MDIELLEKEKDSIRIKFMDADMTVVSPLVDELLGDEVVAKVDYKAGHPELDAPIISVRVESGKPQTALKRAAKNLSNQFKEAREGLLKELK
ncbi:MAG: RpoL/Rpb11 RNA polymerase subunit family protein [Methanomassiliicoccales archaeon]